MKCITIGLQCSVPEGINRANLREYSYPFDWLWCPSKTTYNILKILINDGVEHALVYMTTGWKYYHKLETTHYVSVNYITENQINPNSGLGNTHFIIDDEYKNKLRKRLERLLRDIQSNERILFLYGDAANSLTNYYLDEIEYGVDATENLLQIYELIYPINNNIKMIYFCWNQRKKENNDKIEYISFDFQYSWGEASEIIKDYLINCCI
jgi:hypothetical protein